MKKPLSRLQPAGLSFLAALAMSPDAPGQAYARGWFTLRCEVEWQGQALPAGSYRFEIPQGDPRFSVLVLSREDPRRIRIIALVPAVSETFLHSSALRIVTVSGKHYVCALQVSPIGRSFMYRAPESFPQKLSPSGGLFEAPWFSGTEGTGAEAAKVGRNKE